MLKTTFIAWTLLTAGPALAQDTAPAVQEFEAPFTTTAFELTTSPMGDDLWAFVTESFPIHTTTDGPLAGLGGHCLYTGVSKKGIGAIRASGTCILFDANGNELWQSWEGGDESGTFVATGNWTGGTGRFEGASGEAHFEATWVAEVREGVNQLTGVRRGTLVLPAN